MDVFARYWKERGGKIQWIAEGHPDVDDWKTNIKQSIDFGASAVYVQGVIGDQWLKAGRLDLLGKCVEFVKSQGVPGGIGAHKLEVIIESEKNEVRRGVLREDPAPHQLLVRPPSDQTEDVVDNRTDNYWDMDPEKTIAFMQEVAEALDRLQGAGRRRHPARVGLPLCLRERRGFHLRGHVRFPGRGQRRPGQAPVARRRQPRSGPELLSFFKYQPPPVRLFHRQVALYDEMDREFAGSGGARRRLCGRKQPEA